LERETGFEPATSGLEGHCSGQLSYSRTSKYIDVTPETVRTELNRYRRWVEPAIGNKALNEITSADVIQIKEVMQEAGLSAQSIKHTLALVRQMFKYATNLQLFSGQPPTEGVKVIVGDTGRRRYLTRIEAEALIKEIGRRSQQVADYSQLSLYSGMRAGELFSLHWSRVDFDLRLIHLVDTKNGCTRQAFFTDAVETMLLRRYSDHKGKGLVFPDRFNNQIKQVSDTFERAVNMLKLNKGIQDDRDKVVFHTLRHTFASWLAMAGTPMRTLAELMGHKSMRMTMRYAHLSPDHKRAAVAALASL
jgi:integrase